MFFSCAATTAGKAEQMIAAVMHTKTVLQKLFMMPFIYGQQILKKAGLFSFNCASICFAAAVMDKPPKLVHLKV